MGLEILGQDRLERNLKAFGDGMERGIGAMIEASTLDLQREVVLNAPVHTGQARDALARPDAVKFRRDARGNAISGEFGALTAQIRRLTYYLVWVETGTKGYSVGDRRIVGVSRSGKLRFRKVKRASPARPPHPFWVPAAERVFQRIQRRRALLQIAHDAWGGTVKVTGR